MKNAKQTKGIEYDLDFVLKNCIYMHHNCTEKMISKKHTKMLLLVSLASEIICNFYLFIVI